MPMPIRLLMGAKIGSVKSINIRIIGLPGSLTNQDSNARAMIARDTTCEINWMKFSMDCNKTPSCQSELRLTIYNDNTTAIL